MNPVGKAARLIRSVSVRFASPDDAWAAPFLNEGERRVFLRMDPRDREHALRVARRLHRDQPGVAETLIAAALLHDCGKSARPYKLWERVLAGLLPTGAAARFVWAPLQVRAQHPLLGADALREAGARPEVVRLVARHHAPGEDPGARLLHRYDALE